MCSTSGPFISWLFYPKNLIFPSPFTSFCKIFNFTFPPPLVYTTHHNQNEGYSSSTY